MLDTLLEGGLLLDLNEALVVVGLLPDGLALEQTQDDLDIESRGGTQVTHEHLLERPSELLAFHLLEELLDLLLVEEPVTDLLHEEEFQADHPELVKFQLLLIDLAMSSDFDLKLVVVYFFF